MLGTVTYDPSATKEIQILPTMLLKSFRLKVFKTFRTANMHLSKYAIILAFRLDDGSIITLETQDDQKEMSWWGVNDGMTIYVYFDDKA